LLEYDLFRPATFILCMMAMAPTYYGYHNILVDFAAYLAVVLIAGV